MAILKKKQISGVVATSGSQYITGSLTLTEYVIAPAFTGSLSGTASYAISASWAPGSDAASSSFAISASYALTASYVLAVSQVSSSYSNTSSYSLHSDTASYALTASYVLAVSQVSSSYSNTSSYSLSSSYALTASVAPNYVLNSVTSSMLTPYVLTSQTSSMFVSSSIYANTASYSLNSNTASYTLNAVSSSYSTQSNSALTASYTVSPINSFGDMIYGDASGAPSKLYPNTSSALMFLGQQGTGSGSVAPTWQVLPTYSTNIYVLGAPTSSISSSYNQLISLSTFTSSSLTTITTSVTNSPTLLGTFATNLGYPNINIIPAGIYTVHYETKKQTGARIYSTYVKLYSIDVNNLETLIFTSDNTTSTADNINIQNIIAGIISNNFVMSVTDRLILRIYAVANTGTSDIDLLFDDNTNSRLELPSIAVDATNFIPYAGAVRDVNLNGKIITNAIWSGSMITSSSYAISSSYALSSSYSIQSNNAATAAYFNGTVTSASYATTSSYTVNASTASYVLNAISASYSNNSSTASYILNAVSASNVLSSSFATQANTALTASYFNGNSVSSSYATTSSYALNSNTSSYILNAVSSSYSLSASFAKSSSTASYVLNAISSSYSLNSDTASYIITAQTASYVLNAISSSFAATAKTASYIVTAQTASYILNAISSSYATNALTASYALNSSGASTTFPFTGSAIISGSLYISGSTTSTNGFTGSLLGTASYASTSITASYVLNAISSSFSTTTYSASYSNNLLEGIAYISSSASTSSLTSLSKYQQIVTGSNSQYIYLPTGSSIPLGTAFSINNNTNSNVFVASAESGSIQNIIPGYTSVFTFAFNTASLAAWDVMSMQMGMTSSYSTTAATASYISSYTGLVESFSINDIGSNIPAQTYTVEYYAEYGYTISEVRAISTSGTCTAALQIGGVPVTGSGFPLSITSAQASGSASSNNTVVVGNKVTFVLTSNSSLVNLQATIKTIRT